MAFKFHGTGLTRGVAALLAAVFFAFTPGGQARAAGTAAGSTISNTATATYDDGNGNTQTINSNTVDITVDELLDVVVDATDPADVIVLPGSTNRVLTYTVTNNGNGSEAFVLAANGTIGGDNFDPTTTSIVIDDGNGVYDPGVDTVYVPGSNDPILAAGATRTIFVLSSIPGGVADGDRGLVRLTAAARTGTGAPGTTLAGQGDGGSNAVVGATGADSQAEGAFRVSAATLSFVKSASFADPFGGTQPVPGAIVTYTLVATVSGSGTLNNLVIGDAVPANTSYQPGTITLQGGVLTDAPDADAGRFTGSAVSVSLGNLAAGATRTVTFQVRIN